MQRAALAKEQSMKKATNVDLNLPQQCGEEGVERGGEEGMFLAIAMHLFISKETRAPALPGAKGAGACGIASCRCEFSNLR